MQINLRPIVNLTEAPCILKVYVDTEIVTHLGISSNQRKARILLSNKLPLTVSGIREAVERKIVKLSGQQYKLRYRPASESTNSINVPLKALNDSNDLQEALQLLNPMQASLQVFVQVSPGVFPPLPPELPGAASADLVMGTRSQNDHKNACVLHPAVIEMRKACIDPTETDSYAMVSFFCLHGLGADVGAGPGAAPSPKDFAAQLELLWRPFLALGRVGYLILYPG
jgi:hypothetical protein